MFGFFTFLFCFTGVGLVWLFANARKLDEKIHRNFFVSGDKKQKISNYRSRNLLTKIVYIAAFCLLISILRFALQMDENIISLTVQFQHVIMVT